MAKTTTPAPVKQAAAATVTTTVTTPEDPTKKPAEPPAATSTETPATETPATEQTPDQDNQPPKTDDNDIDKRVEDALKKRDDEAAKKKAEETAAAELEEAKKQGNFEKLYTAETEKTTKLQKEVDDLKAEVKSSKVRGSVRDYLDKNAPDYIGGMDYIFRDVKWKMDSTGPEVEKEIKAAVDRFVTANPRTSTARTTEPNPRSANQPATTQKEATQAKTNSLNRVRKGF